MRAHGLGERVVLGTDIYEMFHRAALRRLVRERLLKLLFYEVAGTVNFTAECACLLVSCVQSQKTFSKARSEPHTSTNFFVVWKTSAGIFREQLFSTSFLSAVKCRAGNCRARGAEISPRSQIPTPAPQHLAQRAPRSRAIPARESPPGAVKRESLPTSGVIHDVMQSSPAVLRAKRRTSFLSYAPQRVSQCALA